MAKSAVFNCILFIEADSSWDACTGLVLHKFTASLVPVCGFWGNIMLQGVELFIVFCSYFGQVVFVYELVCE